MHDAGSRDPEPSSLNPEEHEEKQANLELSLEDRHEYS